MQCTEEEELNDDDLSNCTKDQPLGPGIVSRWRPHTLELEGAHEPQARDRGCLQPSGNELSQVLRLLGRCDRRIGAVHVLGIGTLDRGVQR